MKESQNFVLIANDNASFEITVTSPLLDKLVRGMKNVQKHCRNQLNTIHCVHGRVFAVPGNVDMKQ
jgi:hypothetical protein